MLAWLPLLVLLSNSVIIQNYFKIEKRESLILSAIIIGVLITSISELLSLFHHFRAVDVISIWGGMTMVSCIAMIPCFNFEKIKINWQKYSNEEKIMFIFIVFTIMITCLTAAFSMPNNWDSMSYHLSRLEHWVQNKTIAYYPCNIIRQLYYSPWAEFAMAHLRLLNGSQTSVNMVQWLSMIGTMVAVSLIAKQLGALKRGQLLASLISITLPMGILQSTSTQTDYVETFWLISFVFCLMEMQKKFNILYVLTAGFSLGLAFLTKGIGCILLIPFLIWQIIKTMNSRQNKKLSAFFVIISLALVLNSGFFLRNQQAFGSVIGIKNSTGAANLLVNSSFDIKVLGGNLIRNFSAQIGTPLYKTNQFIEKAAIKTAGFFSIDINDPRAIFHDTKFSISPMSTREDYCGNLLHTFVFSILFIFCFLKPKLVTGARAYMAAVCCSVILFCWIVRWQPYISRFHLPLFILFCPLAGLILERISSRTILLGIIFFVGSLPWMFFNHQHHWFGRLDIWRQSKLDQYFQSRPNLEKPYKMAAEQVRNLGCKQVGIILKGDSWEYPLWVLFKTFKPMPQWRIEHVQVNNESSQLSYPLGSFAPCGVIAIEDDPPSINLTQGNYKRIWDYQDKEGFKSAVYAPLDSHIGI